MKNFSSILLIFTISFLLFSCLSDPETKYKEANSYKEKIKKYDLQKYDIDDYNLAEKNYEEGKALMDSKKYFKADKILLESNKSYKQVISKGFPLCTEERDNDTLEKKKLADDIKANVAVKDQYDDALKTYNDAIKYKNNKNYENSIELLDKSKQKFEQAYKDSEFKKDRAEKSIESTEASLKQIENNANELETQIKKLNEENK